MYNYKWLLTFTKMGFYWRFWSELVLKTCSRKMVFWFAIPRKFPVDWYNIPYENFKLINSKFAVKRQKIIKIFDALPVHFCLKIHNSPLLCLLIMQFSADGTSINGQDFECQDICAQRNQANTWYRESQTLLLSSTSEVRKM